MAAVSDPEREYQEAKAAYGAALARLKAAKAARPPQPQVPSRWEIADARRERIWQAYLAGDRDFCSLAQRFGVLPARVRVIVKRELAEHAHGPFTRDDWRSSEWYLNG